MSAAAGDGRGELRALTGARGIAAWLVVLYHIRLSVAGLPAGIVAVLAKGYLAVDFFFLLSGFVIWLAWHERLHAGGGAQAAAFLLRRVARIWPLHLLLLGTAALLALALAATGHPDAREYPFAQLPLHVLLLQNWGFTDALAWNEPAWSISTEVAAYLCFALLGRRTDWTRWPTGLLVALAAALLLALHLAMTADGLLSSDIVHFGLLRCLAEFGTGTIVAALWCRTSGRGVEGGWGGSWARPALLAAALAGARAAGAPETLVVPALLALVLAALAGSAGRPGNPLEGRLVHYLGQISFATYLSHMLLWRVVKLALVSDPRAVPPAVVLLYLGVVLAASAVLYARVEVPAQRWVQRLPAMLPRWPDRRLRRPVAPR